MATWQAVLAGGFKEIVFVYVYWADDIR